MDQDEPALLELMELYAPVRGQIEERLRQFRRVWEEGREEDMLRELVFCLLTPQSRARSCWGAVEGLCREGLLHEGCSEKVQAELKGVRFKHRKAEYICLAREALCPEGKPKVLALLRGFVSPEMAREWLVQNVMGMGYKEASHFLRNIGLGEGLAILDRHILRNLVRLGVIEEIPQTLTRRRYLEIEGLMKRFSEEIGIPLDHLDLLLWYREAGEVFK